jgi:SAM-dependent methyltransferase
VSEREPKIILDPSTGFRRLDPVPEPDELAEFYTSRYYDLLRQGHRGPDLRRLIAGGEAADAERRWLEATLYADIVQTLEKRAPGRRVLEVGCGVGQFLSFLKSRGFEACGVEPSAQAVEIAHKQDLDVIQGEMVDWVRARERASFDSVVLVNVLEHVPDPSELLTLIRGVLVPGGVVCVRVPNDFSEIQEAAHQHLQGNRWWIAAPDHINYFDFGSLRSTLRTAGFEPFDSQGDFPMEFFLLMGLDYTSDADHGAQCHQWRVTLEQGIPQSLRRDIYRSLAEVGVGRNATVFAQLPKATDQLRRVDMDQFRVSVGHHTYVELREVDIETLRLWRNAQMNVLRQKKPLDAEGQERWFKSVVQPTHAQRQPAFLLVSILDPDDQFIGYGGLTNIEWTDRRAEVSFLVDPIRADNRELYQRDFSTFLSFLKQWSFEDLGLNRIFTETYAYRKSHIEILEASGFRVEGRLEQHIVDPDRPNTFADSIIHGITAGNWKENAE